MKATIYHNARCSKSRATLAILEQQNLEIEEIFYLETPPSKETLAALCVMMNIKPFEIVRTGEALFKELGLSKQDLKSDDEWLTILSDNPRLIERPIVQIGDRAIIGRPPENVLTII